jgi:hypothetical protein
MMASPAMTMGKIIVSALAATCLFGAISASSAGYRRDGVDYAACTYVWNGFARVPSCQMLAPIKSSQQKMISRSQTSLPKAMQ